MSREEEELEREERRSEESDLKKAISEGDSIKELIGTPAGKLLLDRLHERYYLVVLGAVKESENFRLAAQSLEEIAAYLGDTMKISDVAREHLTKLMSGTEEDY